MTTPSRAGESREQASEISLGLTDHPSDRTLPPVALAFAICAILALWMLA